MPRPPRIQLAGANYHVVTRGDGRRQLFHDTGHYERFTGGLEDEHPHLWQMAKSSPSHFAPGTRFLRVLCELLFSRVLICARCLACAKPIVTVRAFALSPLQGFGW